MFNLMVKVTDFSHLFPPWRVRAVTAETVEATLRLPPAPGPEPMALHQLYKVLIQVKYKAYFKEQE